MRKQLTLAQFKIWLTELTEYDYWSDFAKEGYTPQKILTFRRPVRTFLLAGSPVLAMSASCINTGRR